MRTILMGLLAVCFIGLGGCSKDDSAENVDIPVISSVSFSKNSFGLGQLISVKCVASTQSDEALTYEWKYNDENTITGDSIGFITSHLGENTLSLTCISSQGVKKDTVMTFNVQPCDYGFALWGDSIDVVMKSESKTYESQIMNSQFKFYGDGEIMYYSTSGGKMAKGVTHSFISLPSFNDSQLASVYESHITKYNALVSRYGDPVSQSITGSITGNNVEDGKALVNGMLRLNYSFEDSRTSITYSVFQRQSSVTVMFVTEYLKK